MALHRDYTGVSETCPLINHVRDFIEGIRDDETGYDIRNSAKEACLLLERIRKMNSDLRDFGNSQYKELYEMEKDRDYYKNLASDLEKEVENLKSDFCDLVERLSEEKILPFN